MENQESEQNAAPQVVQVGSSPKSHKSWLMLLVGLLLGAAIASAVWYFMRSNSTPVSTPQTTASSQNSKSSSSKSSSSSSSTTANCTADDLSLSPGTSEGAAGTIYQHMVVTNKSTKSCTLTGYPLVSLYDPSNAVLGVAAAPLATYPISTITLAPSAKGHIAVGFPQVGNFDAGVCSADSSTIRVYLPGSASYMYATLAKPNCPGFSATAFAAGA